MPDKRPVTRNAAGERLVNYGLRYDGKKWVEYDVREVHVPEEEYLAALQRLGFLVFGTADRGWGIIDQEDKLAGVLQYRP